MREIAAAEDRRPDDEPPAKLIPFALGAYRVKLRRAGEEGGGRVSWHSGGNSWDRLALSVCPEGISEQILEFSFLLLA